jgi:hypothetical protein
VNPSPSPEPHNFQNPMPGTRGKERRAAPICPSTHRRADHASNL